MVHIIAIDPGKASGIASFQYSSNEEPTLLKAGEYQMKEYAAPLRLALATAQELNVAVSIVCERFTINAGTVRNSQAPYSLEQIGILKQVMLDFGIDPDTLVLQSPADAKKMFPNEALKKISYWHRGGEGHANDAIRHGLLRAVKLGWKPTALLS